MKKINWRLKEVIKEAKKGYTFTISSKVFLDLIRQAKNEMIKELANPPSKKWLIKKGYKELAKLLYPSKKGV